MNSYERSDLSDTGWDPSEPANDPPEEEREAEVEYTDASGRVLFAIVTLNYWGTEAIRVEVFDEDDNRVKCEDDVIDAIVQKAMS